MVQTSDDGAIEDREALSDGLRRVIEKGIKVRVRCETEASNALLSTVDNQVRSIGESCVQVSEKELWAG